MRILNDPSPLSFDPLKKILAADKTPGTVRKIFYIMLIPGDELIIKLFLKLHLKFLSLNPSANDKEKCDISIFLTVPTTTTTIPCP